MLKLVKISYMDSDLEEIAGQVQLSLFHQDEDVSAIAEFHVAIDMTRAEFEAKSIGELIDAAKPLIQSKIQRIVI